MVRANVCYGVQAMRKFFPYKSEDRHAKMKALISKLVKSSDVEYSTILEVEHREKGLQPLARLLINQYMEEHHQYATAIQNRWVLHNCLFVV